MEITIADLKSLCQENSDKENIYTESIGNNTDYTFSSFNSKSLFPNNQIVSITIVQITFPTLLLN